MSIIKNIFAHQFSKKVFLILSVVFILVMIVVVYNFKLRWFQNISEESFSFIDKANEENFKLVKLHSTDSLSLKQKKILLKKVTVINHIKNNHRHLVITLSKNNYALLSFFPFLSAITAILAFLIIQKGWHASNKYLKTYFITFTTLTSLAGILPDVFQQTKSIEKHKQNYLKCENIQKQIYNYMLTAPILEKDTLSFNEFINNINTQEKGIINLIYEIEKKSINNDIFDTKKITP